MTLNIFKPLLFDMETNTLSLGRFYFNLLLMFCCYYWFYLNIEIPSSLLQVLLIVTSYLFASKGVRKVYNVGQNYVEKKFNSMTDGKNTKEMNEYKVKSSEAAKCED